MKLYIKVIVVLLVLAAIALGGAYQLPKQSVNEKTVYLQATPEQVYVYLENPTEWVRWNAWNKAYDPTMIQLFGGPMRGAGARVTWDGDKIGSKQMVLTKSESPIELEYEITQEEQTHKTLGRFELVKIEQGTLVRWHEQTDLNNNPVDLVKGAWHQYVTAKEMEQGLGGLKTLVEQNSKIRANR